MNQLKMNGSGLDCKILNNRHWFDCFELIKGYIISNWIGYGMKLNCHERDEQANISVVVGE